MSKERFKELVQNESSAPDPSTPGMTAKEVLGKVWDELSHAGAHGSHEMAAALFRGDAFVMYGKEGQSNENQQEAPVHGLPQEATKQLDHQQEQERGGMEM